MAVRHFRVTKILVTALAIGVSLFVFGSTALADSGANHSDSPRTAQSTTLDACGYFIGYQTASNSEITQSGSSTTTTQKGTWTGVTNNYFLTPVVSLGEVQGAFTDTHTKDNVTGAVSGMETFVSNAGKITQNYSFNTATGWTVTVSADRDLSFLTSSTAGQCYKGPFPRP